PTFLLCFSFLFFFFIAPVTTVIYTLSLHDALPICHHVRELVAAEFRGGLGDRGDGVVLVDHRAVAREAACGQLHPHHRLLGSLEDRKSTRLNSSHDQISYAVFCLKKKKNQTHQNTK